MLESLDSTKVNDPLLEHGDHISSLGQENSHDNPRGSRLLSGMSTKLLGNDFSNHVNTSEGQLREEI